MRLPGGFKTYLHSLVGIAIAMIVIFTVLHFVQTRGPAIVAGPAGALGSTIGGARYNF